MQNSLTPIAVAAAVTVAVVFIVLVATIVFIAAVIAILKHIIIIILMILTTILTISIIIIIITIIKPLLIVLSVIPNHNGKPLWKKKETTKTERTVEYTTIDPLGNLQELFETEVTEIEVEKQ